MPFDSIKAGSAIRNVLTPDRWEKNEKAGCEIPPPSPMPPSVVGSFTLPACLANGGRAPLSLPTDMITRLLAGRQAFSQSESESTNLLPEVRQGLMRGSDPNPGHDNHFPVIAKNEDNVLLPLWAITGFATLCLLLGAGLKISDISTAHLNGSRVYWYSMSTISGAVVVAIGTVIRNEMSSGSLVVPDSGGHVMPALVDV
ncbi:hypothetical protein FRC09_000598 [Ceratobasidium sp. 395]|nr:hypothetical protein FRC09_000598 [Ceratobasidium sp. 395]